MPVPSDSAKVPPQNPQLSGPEDGEEEKKTSINELYARFHACIHNFYDSPKLHFSNALHLAKTSFPYGHLGAIRN
jgi:hypothetical protein